MRFLERMQQKKDRYNCFLETHIFEGWGNRSEVKTSYCACRDPGYNPYN